MTFRLFGKHRGIVQDNVDPQQLGRITAIVPNVLGEIITNWALPCVPPNQNGTIGSSLPSVGSSVWIEFENGEPEFPVWTGCFYHRSADTPDTLRSL